MYSQSWSKEMDAGAHLSPFFISLVPQVFSSSVKPLESLPQPHPRHSPDVCLPEESKSSQVRLAKNSENTRQLTVSQSHRRVPGPDQVKPTWGWRLALVNSAAPPVVLMYSDVKDHDLESSTMALWQGYLMVPNCRDEDSWGRCGYPNPMPEGTGPASNLSSEM